MPPLLDPTVGTCNDRPRADPRLPLGVVLFVGLMASWVVAVPLSLARTALPWAVALAVMAAVVATVSWWGHPGAGLGVAGMGWLMLNGFVVHQYGNLGWDGRRDIVRLATLLLTATAAAGAHGLLLGRQRRRVPRTWGIPHPRSPELDRLRPPSVKRARKEP